MERLWGDSRIASRFNRTGCPEPCGEAWEVSARPEAPSRIINGPLAGLTLDILWRRLQESGVVPGSQAFPLLVKLIDAREMLSVQVHPGSENQANGEEAKNEMWHMLETSPRSVVYAGLVPGATKERLRQAVTGESITSLMIRQQVETGQSLFIPGGCVHAVGGGCLFYEVQQNSDTTYRLYDWDRMDANGKKRQLHVAESLRTIAWESPPPKLTEARTEPVNQPGPPVIDCPYFRFWRFALTSEATIPRPRRLSLTVLFPLQGSLVVNFARAREIVEPGRSALIVNDGEQDCRLSTADPRQPCSLLLTQA